MQLSSEIQTGPLRSAPGAYIDRLAPSGGWRLIVAISLMVLAFVPLVPPVDALEGGVTTRGIIEFALILFALGLLAMYLKTQGAFSVDLKSPAFLIISAYCWWCMLSFIWSPNPVLTIAKAAELWCIALAALMVTTFAARSHFNERQIATVFALSLVAVICGLILANLYYWGKPFPSTGDASLPLDLLGEEFVEQRPRLILAYQHALVTADLLAVTIITLFASDLRKIFKAILFPGLLALLWLTNARAATVAVAIAIASMAMLKLRRNSSRAITAMLGLATVVAGLLLFQDRLPALVRPLLSDDLFTLNSRTELWAKVFTYICEQPIAGTGYYGSRYLLIKDFSWAGHAHNSFLEVQLTTGLIGLLLLIAFVVFICKEIFITRNALLVGITLYALIQGMVDPVLFYPDLVMFALTIVLTSVNPGRSPAGERSFA